MSATISVDIWSDIACPWCYIGKRRFEEGAAAYRAAHPEGPAVEVVYRSFELAPDTPADYRGGEAQYLAEHKGIPLGQAEALLGRVTEIAASVGLDYRFDTVKHVKTVAAHRALHHAKAHGLQLDLVERLLRAYFVEGRDLADPGVLADLAAEVGLDRAGVLRALADGEYADDVRADIEQAAAYGITGVPFFVFDGAYGLSGAQEATAFTEVLEHVVRERGVREHGVPA